MLTGPFDYSRSSLLGGIIGAVFFMCIAPFIEIDLFEQIKVFFAAVVVGITIALAVTYLVNSRVDQLRR